MWWKNWLPFHTGKSIPGPKEQETIFSDASKKGWGAHSDPLEIGRWCLEERIQHINILELQAAFLAIKALLPKINRPHLQFVIDSQTAVTYIHKLGGTHSHQLSLLAVELLHFALKRNLTLSAVYIPGIKNRIADRKSRVFKDTLEWVLNSASVSTDLAQKTWDRSRSVYFQNKSLVDIFRQLETRARCNGMRYHHFA